MHRARGGSRRRYDHRNKATITHKTHGTQRGTRFPKPQDLRPRPSSSPRRRPSLPTYIPAPSFPPHTALDSVYRYRPRSL